MRDREEDRMTVEWAGTPDAFPSKFHRRVATRHSRIVDMTLWRNYGSWLAKRG